MISIPTIMVICLILGEFYKSLIGNKEKLLALLPTFAGLLGGILGLLMFFVTPSAIPTANVFHAFIMGVFSGLSSTGTHQLIKQLKNYKLL